MVDIECSPCSEIGVHLQLRSTPKFSLLSAKRRKEVSTKFIQNFQLQLFFWFDGGCISENQIMTLFLC